MRRVLLFTDIEGSTRLWEKNPESMSAALAAHDSLIAGLIPRYKGIVVKNTGDGIFAAFPGGSDVLGCLLEIICGVSGTDALGLTLSIRCGIHCAPVEERDGDLFGPGVILAQRVMDSGRGGQVLLTGPAAEVVPLPAGGLLEDLGVQRLRDLSAPRRLFSFHHPAMPESSGGPLRTLSAVPNNFQRPLTPFVGRERELLEVCGLLRGGENRLVTILGPGGSGKSRLALQAAAEVSSRYPDGLFVVPLAELDSADHVMPMVALAAGPVSEGGGTTEERLVTQFTGKKVLLVLDNMEHVTDAALEVKRLLEKVPGLVVLATSRQRLRLPVEQVYRLSGLDLGAGRDGGSTPRDGLRLFIETSRRVAGPGEWSGEETEAAGTICRLLEGNPLGIILASSWTSVLAPSSILAELEKGFSLTSNMDGLPLRHKSLRNAFMFSWKLLDSDEQETLCRLSRFRGGFRREDAFEVCGLDLVGISSLVDKSLVETRENGGYILHPLVLDLVRSLAEEVLGPEGIKDVSDRHSAHFCGLLAERSGDLNEGDSGSAASALAGSLDNIREAWRYCVEIMDIDRMQSCCLAIRSLFGIMSAYEEGESFFAETVEALKVVEESPEATRLLAWLMSCRGWFASYLRTGRESANLLKRSVELFRGTEDTEGLAWALNQLGNVLYVDGDYAGSGKAYRESLELRRREGLGSGVAAVLNNLGNLSCESGDFGRAEIFYSESLSIDRKRGNIHGVSASLTNLAVVALNRDMLDRAEALLEEALEMEEGIGDRYNQAIIRGVFARVMLRRGDLEQVKEVCQGNLEVYRETGNAWGEVETLLLMVEVCTEGGDHHSAAAHLLKALDRAMGRHWQPQLRDLLRSSVALLGQEQHETVFRVSDVLARGDAGMEQLEAACAEARAAIAEMFTDPS